MRLSPLDGAHRELGAKMTGFGGWEMPLAYGTGTIAEHNACRTSCAVFDVSHLGTVRLTTDGAFDLLQSTLTNDLGKIRPGRAQYTHLLDDDGSVLDDIIVWWVDEGRFDVMPNASNTDRVISAIGGTDVTNERAVIAVQGPTARTVVSRVLPDAAGVGRFEVRLHSADGVPIVVAGTGYTGEDGLELAVPADHASKIFTSLLEAGGTAAGLGARDTLRLEAGLPLHGHELGPGISPLQAGLGWVVAWDKPEFRGREALLAERSTGPDRILRGLSIPGRRPAREGASVHGIDGRVLGTVTSGNFSPTLGHCIAMCFLPPGIDAGTAVHVDVRGDLLPAAITGLPFVTKKK